MKLSRRTLLAGVGVSALLAPWAKAATPHPGGYLTPYGVAGKYVLSEKPFHCAECYRGQLALVEMDASMTAPRHVRFIQH